MIPYAWMGVLALLILWTHTLLIASVALKRAAWIRRHRMLPFLEDPEEGVGIARVRVESGRGPDGALAAHVVEQRGRQLAESHPTIGWHDREHRSDLFGGTTTWRDVLLRIEPTSDAEVWPDRSQQLRAAALPDVALFEAVLTRAVRAKGELREVRVPILTGHDAFVVGRFRRRGDVWTVRPDGDLPLVVSQVDPLAWGDATTARLLGFAVALIVGAGIITGLCLVPPAFGVVSTIGGVLGLAFFLLIQPAGTWVRDRTTLPAYRPLEGRWVVDRITPTGGRAPVS